MQKTFIELFREIMKLPAAKRAGAFMVALPFAIIIFYESRDNYARNRVKELELALNISEIKREQERNQYISSLKDCAADKIKIVDRLNGLLSEYKEQQRQRDEQRAAEMQSELNQLRRGVKQTDIILQKTIQIQKN